MCFRAQAVRAVRAARAVEICDTEVHPLRLKILERLLPEGKLAFAKVPEAVGRKRSLRWVACEQQELDVRRGEPRHGPRNRAVAEQRVRVVV